MKKILLRGRNISKAYSRGEQETRVLQGIDVDIYEGDFTVIMGPSGAGKSTLLYALSGMEKITSGRIDYKNRNIGECSEKSMAELRAREFGFIFQQIHLVSSLSLLENIAVAGYLDKKKSEKEVNEKAGDLLNRMGAGDAGGRLPRQVSGGEAQRAAIARSLVNDPSLLFADEPTGALNRRHSGEVLDILSDLHSSSQSILMVTHDLRAAVRGNRILYLEDGRILDELVLPDFQVSQEKERMEQVNRWLSGTAW